MIIDTSQKIMLISTKKIDNYKKEKKLVNVIYDRNRELMSKTNYIKLSVLGIENSAKRKLICEPDSGPISYLFKIKVTSE